MLSSPPNGHGDRHGPTPTMRPRRIVLLLFLMWEVPFAGGARAEGGRIEPWTFHSAVLGREVAVELFVPEERSAQHRPWATLYLLHGLAGNARDWVDSGKIGEVMATLLAAKKIPPMLVVMPDGGDSWFIDDPRPGGFGAVFAAFSAELVDTIDRAFPTARCRAQRLIGGLSMGGYGALLMGMKRPDRFGAVLGLSSAIFLPAPNHSEVPRHRPVFTFGELFHYPFDWQRYDTWNLFNLIPAFAKAAAPPDIWLDAGDDDFPELLSANVLFYQALQRANVAAELRIVDGAHDWAHWRRSLVLALEWAGAGLADRCAPSASPTNRLLDGP